MANEDVLRNSVQKWNAWRTENPDVRPDLSKADLRGAYLSEANLRQVTLSQARLQGVDLRGAILSGANLHSANLCGADLRGADLRGADLREADMRQADLSLSNCVYARLQGANLTGCTVFGVSAWCVELDESTRQNNLRITPLHEPEITVDNLQMAQFLYLVLHNQNIRTILDTLTGKVVLILGRFSRERKLVLDALRGGLRVHGYVPILFDFVGPANHDNTETVTILARMARFVVADLTDPGSVPYELAKIVPDAHVPVQPLLLKGSPTFAMVTDLWLNPEMLEIYHYASLETLLGALHDHIIVPAETKFAEIQRKRASAMLRSGLLPEKPQ